MRHSEESTKSTCRHLFERIRSVGEYPGMVSLRSDQTGERTARIGARSQAADDVVEVIPRPPTKFISSTLIDVYALNLREHLPAPPLIFGLIIRDAVSHNPGRINP